MSRQVTLSEHIKQPLPENFNKPRVESLIFISIMFEYYLSKASKFIQESNNSHKGKRLVWLYSDLLKFRESTVSESYFDTLNPWRKKFKLSSTHFESQEGSERSSSKCTLGSSRDWSWSRERFHRILRKHRSRAYRKWTKWWYLPYCNKTFKINTDP